MIAHQILKNSTSPLTTISEANAQAVHGFISGVGDIKLSETWVFADGSCLHMTCQNHKPPLFQAFNTVFSKRLETIHEEE